MISKLNGVITDKFFDSIIVDVSGVGYELYVTPKVFSSLTVGSKKTFFTSLVVSKDMDFRLFGFDTKLDIDFFKMLTTVSGVGPKSAFTIISSKDTQETKIAISNADKSFFKDVSGVGPKLAMKIILELQDKVGKQKELEVSVGLSKENKEILEAVKSMGYDVVLAKDILEELDSSLAEGEKIKHIISTLSR